MSDRADDFKRILASAIERLQPNTFQRREAFYNDARRMLAGRGTPEDLLLLEKTIRETEGEIAALARRHIDLLARRARLITFIAFPAIGLLFTAAQLRDINLLEMFGTLNPDITFNISLTLYYLVLGIGFSFDINTQKQIYVLDPNRGKLSRDSMVAILLNLLTGAVLFATSKNFIIFAVALTIWHFGGMFFWRVLARQTAPMISESERSAVLREDYYALERLRLARTYISGNWHYPRHSILSALVLLFDFFAIPNPATQYVTDVLLSNWLELNITTVHLLAFIFLVYAVLGEGWTWLRRFITMISLHILEALERQYRLTKRYISDRDEEAMLPFL